MTTTKQKKNSKLRYLEYYDLQDTLDMLYADSGRRKIFNNLMPLIESEENIRLAYRNIKRNSGSNTSGVDKLTIKDIEKQIKYPLAAKDAQGRLLCGAAVGITSNVLARVEALVKAIVDVIVGRRPKLESPACRIDVGCHTTAYISGTFKLQQDFSRSGVTVSTSVTFVFVAGPYLQTFAGWIDLCQMESVSMYALGGAAPFAV